MHPVGLWPTNSTPNKTVGLPAAEPGKNKMARESYFSCSSILLASDGNVVYVCFYFAYAVCVHREAKRRLCLCSRLWSVCGLFAFTLFALRYLNLRLSYYCTLRLLRRIRRYHQQNARRQNKPLLLECAERRLSVAKVHAEADVKFTSMKNRNNAFKLESSP